MGKKIEDVDANLTGDGIKFEEVKSSWFRRIKKGIDTKHQYAIQRAWLKQNSNNRLFML